MLSCGLHSRLLRHLPALRAQLSLFPKKKNEATGEMESTFETIEEWVPPPPEEAWESEREREIEEAERDDD